MPAQAEENTVRRIADCGANSSRAGAYQWAELMRRTLGLDVLVSCTSTGHFPWLFPPIEDNVPQTGGAQMMGIGLNLIEKVG